MGLSFCVFALLAFLSSSPTVSTTDAFATHAKSGRRAFVSPKATASSSVVEVETKPIAGMKPGTSGLRKKVEVWQGLEGDKYYVENFIQSLLDTAASKNGGTMPKTYVDFLE